MEIKKLVNAIEELDIHGQACTDDCADWSGNSGASPYGCTITISGKGWDLW